jgi:hypothetical protein
MTAPAGRPINRHDRSARSGSTRRGEGRRGRSIVLLEQMKIGEV